MLEVTANETAPYGTIVKSRIVKSNGEPVEIDYMMRQNGGAWQVGDIYLTGTISQLANLRAQFSSVPARVGVNGLVALLNRKAEPLIASAAR